MGRKKSKSVLQPLLEVYPSQICDAMDALVMTPAIPAPPWNDTSWQVVAGLHFDWYIAAYWVAYEIAPIPDRNRFPFNTPRFREQESWGRTLYSILELSKGCSRFGNLQGSSPWTVWLECLNEAKRNQINFVFGSIPAQRTETFIRTKRYFLADLRDGRVPNLKGSPHLRALVKEAQRLRATLESLDRRTFCQQYWDPFVSVYQDFIEDARSDSASKLFFVEGDKLLVQNNRYLKEVLPLIEMTETKLLRKPITYKLSQESCSIDFVPWSLHSVYVRN